MFIAPPKNTRKIVKFLGNSIRFSKTEMHDNWSGYVWTITDFKKLHCRFEYVSHIFQNKTNELDIKCIGELLDEANKIETVKHIDFQMKENEREIYRLIQINKNGKNLIKLLGNPT